MVRKYLNYLIFGVIVLAVVGLAVSHSQHMRFLVDSIAGSDQKAQEAAALELIKGEQFMDTISGEPVGTRVKAAESLEWVANDASIPKGTEKDAPDYRAGAVKQALALLKDLEKPVRDRAVITLEHVGTTSKDNLAALLGGLKDGDNYVRKGTTTALVDPQSGIGPKVDAPNGIDVTQAIVDLMKAESGARGPGGDVLSTPVFKQHGNQARIAALLIAQLADKDAGVRQGAADALGKLGDPSAVAPLKTAMHKDDDPQVRRVAISAIALIAAPSSEDALVEAITDVNTDNEARSQAATGLGKIASKRAVDTLVKALDDDDLKLRSSAVTALARAARPNPTGPVNHEVVTALVAALQGSSDNARAGAAQALQSLGAPDANSALIAVVQNPKYDNDARSAATQALGYPGNKGAVSALVTALSDPDGDINTAARDALTAIGPDAIDPLVAVLQSDRPEAYYASQALANQGAAALPALKKVAEGSNRVAQHWAAVALGGLGSMGVQEVKPVLAQLARSTDDDVQYVATEQLHRLGAQ